MMIGTPLAALFLTSFFILLGFPYDRLADLLAVKVESALDVRLDIGDTNLRLGLFGPGFEFTDVTIGLSSGEDVQLASALIRPAWSLSWFSGEPEIFIAADSPFGRARGTLRGGGAPRWQGEVLGLDVKRLPFYDPDEGLNLEGVVDVDGDLTLAAGSMIGNLDFDVSDGVLGHPMLPAIIPFQRFSGALELGGDYLVALHDVTLSGDDTSLQIQGSIGANEPRPLDIDITIDELEASMKMIMQAMGAKLAENGPTQIHIGGTLASPQIR